jgi:hypothetical protein
MSHDAMLDVCAGSEAPQHERPVLAGLLSTNGTMVAAPPE